MTAADLQTLIGAVDKILLENLNSSELKIARHCPRSCNEGEEPATMQSDKLIQCDMNVELWEAALHAILRDITNHTYPHHSAIQSLFNYTLNCHKYTDVGLVSAVMAQLIDNHPPGTDSMSSYYELIVDGKYAKLNEKTEEDQSFFWVVVDLVTNAQESPEICHQPYPLPQEERDENVKDTLIMLSSKTKSKSIIFYSDLSPAEQRKHSTLCLQFLCDILTYDYMAWLKKAKENWKTKNRPLMAKLLWPDRKQEGYVSQNVVKIIALQRENFGQISETTQVCEKLLALTAELFRIRDRRLKTAYPFFGTCTNAFSRQIAVTLFDRENEEEIIPYLKRLEPPWLRLLLTSQILSNLAGFQCLPELSSAAIIIEHLDYVYKMGRQQTRRNMLQQDRAPADPTLVKKFAKLKSVNLCLSKGMTRLHAACFDDNIEAVRALLTFPSLDLNFTDANGWTALHEAASRGSEMCVREMLAYVPPMGSVQRRVDTRARGPRNFTPLMKAVIERHANICTALLQHTGSVLLEDITDDNENVFDLCKDDEILKILRKYSVKKVVTIHSRKELYLNTGNLILVATLASILVQSYFSVHCTWKVYHEIKKCPKNGNKPSIPNVLFEYSRYHRDFRTNLPKIRSLAMKFKKITDLESVARILICIVSLNKS